jgi:four helix bundle protein
MRDFYDLEVWKKAKALVIEIYRVSKEFPRDERFGLTDQLRRAANSICANLAEGYSRFHTKDKIRFYYNARGSVSECMNHLMIAEELRFMVGGDAKRLVEEYQTVRKMINGLVNSLASAEF